MKMQDEHQSHKPESGKMMYKKLALMAFLSFITMYMLMYAMVDNFTNVIPNTNQFYMAGLMTMPMAIWELVIMGGMYMNNRLNATLTAIGAIGLIVFFTCIHQQVSIGDKQFLKSMIPHHGAAVLMVEKASIRDPQIKELANKIITSQQAEIQQMKNKLKELQK